MKRTNSSWGSHNNQKRKYIPVDTTTQHLLTLSFLRPEHRAPLMIYNNKNSMCEGRKMHTQSPTYKTIRKFSRQMSSTLGINIPNKNMKVKKHIYIYIYIYIERKRINNQRTTLV